MALWLCMLTIVPVLACGGEKATLSPEATVPPSPVPTLTPTPAPTPIPATSTPTPPETAIPIQDSLADQSDKEPFAQSPTVVLIATVVSLSRNSDVNDTAIVRIDDISSIDNPFGWELVGIQEGNDIQVGFTYTSRPAIIRVLPVPERTETAGGDQQTVHFDLASAGSGPVEGGYLIYEYQHSSVEQVTETVLPGLEVGSRFAASISYSSPTRISVGEYEIVPG